MFYVTKFDEIYGKAGQKIASALRRQQIGLFSDRLLVAPQMQRLLVGACADRVIDLKN